MDEETKADDSVLLEQKIVKALEEIGIRVTEITTVRRGYSNFKAPGFIIHAGLPIERLMELKRGL